MRKLIGAALAALCLFATSAEARPHHRSHHARHHTVARHDVRVARSTDSIFSLFGHGGSSLVAEARSQVGNCAIYGRANLWCARFVNYVLRATGHTGTNSDLAFSFARYGRRVSGPQPGAIAVMARRGGGHVGIVSGVDQAGNPILVSGNNQGRVRETVYPARRIAMYVVPD